MSLLVVGSIGIDTIETPLGKVENVIGGSAIYISLAASFFTLPQLVGVCGDDFPSEEIALLKQHNVDLEGLEIVQGGKTFRWGGKYHLDTNNRDTLFTHLNVFQTFSPKIPASYRSSKYVCLGNIDPILQSRVLEQMEQPSLVVCDTMNFWIEGKLAELKKTLERVDVLLANDSEVKLLTNESNLFRAAKHLWKMGPKILIIKKGEHGAILLTEKTTFITPAFPLESVLDPTGAGDSFAGGFIGWLAKTNDISDENLKRAVVYGSTLASFCVEKFSIAKIQELVERDIHSRYRAFRALTHFEE
ncbi:MAG: sugar kinase [Ignavibacteria bacterium]|nr:sugar kinase [Ignavibacteria bacterium]